MLSKLRPMVTHPGRTLLATAPLASIGSFLPRRKVEHGIHPQGSAWHLQLQESGVGLLQTSIDPEKAFEMPYVLIETAQTLIKVPANLTRTKFWIDPEALKREMNLHILL